MVGKLLWVAMGALCAVSVRAEILIGQTAGFTGPVASGVKEASDGALLYIDAVNKRGGVHGEKIQIVSLDDHFEPPKALENARKLIVERKVLALFLTRGTPHTQAILPLLAEHQLPLIAPSTGAMALHQPVNKWVYNVRAPYQREAERAVKHLLSIGVDRIAVVQVQDSFGADAAQGARKGFEAAGKKPVVELLFSREKWDFSEIAPKVVAADAQAVVFLGSGQAVVDGVDALRRAGSRAQIVTLSNNASSGFVKSLKDHGPGTIITQVFPSERSLSVPLAKEAFDMAKANGAELTPAMLEGFAAAKVLVTALERAGPRPTPDKLRQALDGMQRVNIGGMEINFSPTRHTGLEFVDLSIVSRDGSLRR